MSEGDFRLSVLFRGVEGDELRADAGIFPALSRCEEPVTLRLRLLKRPLPPMLILMCVWEYVWMPERSGL